MRATSSTRAKSASSICTPTGVQEAFASSVSLKRSLSNIRFASENGDWMEFVYSNESFICIFFQVPFVAINCFNPNGECRKVFNMAKYPQILVAIRDVGLLPYTGPHQLTYLSKYIEFLERPIERIDTFEQFLQFILLNDVTLIDTIICFFVARKPQFYTLCYFTLNFKGAMIAHFNFSSKRDQRINKFYYQSSIMSYSLGKKFMCSLRCFFFVSNYKEIVISSFFLQDPENSIKYGLVVNKDLWKRLAGFEKKRPKANITTSNAKIIAFSSNGFEAVCDKKWIESDKRTWINALKTIIIQEVRPISQPNCRLA